jgi:polyisoprenoid-binding protein YceI
MKAKFTAFLLLMLFTISGIAAGLKLTPGKYNIDAAHTRVSFLIDHFVVSQVQGRFNDVKGYFILSPKMEECKIDVLIPVSSLDTAVQKRDEHLKSADFFEVTKFPNMTFKSKKFIGKLDDFKVIGDLTIKDVTKEVTLTGKYSGSVKDSWKNIRAAVRATGKINRQDFNIKYNDVVEAVPAVGDEVTINIISEGIYQDPKAPKSN